MRKATRPLLVDIEYVHPCWCIESVRAEDESIRGVSLSPAGQRGVVRIVNSPADMAKMQKSDVLVSITTNPDVVPTMKKAAAIVTEQDGVTGHAAIVSRELGVPCVIRTKVAMRVLREGERVEVDATNGIVRRLDA